MDFNEHNKNTINIHYDITLACNNRCPYCYKLDRLDNTKVFNEDTFDSVIEQVSKIKDYKIIVDLVGGEPLLVVDKAIEFVERVAGDNVFVEIITNFNFPDGETIDKLVKLRETNKNFGVTASFHDSSNSNYVKNNIIRCVDFCTVNFLIDNKNLYGVYERVLWAKNIAKVKYSVEGIIVDEKNTFTLLNNLIFKEIARSSLDNQDLVVIDGKSYDYIQSMKMDFLNISKQYYTICKMSQFMIDFDGNISSVCGYPYNGGNVRDGLEVKDIFCNGYSCRCTTSAYKRLVKERK